MGKLSPAGINSAISAGFDADTSLADGEGLSLRLRKGSKPIWTLRYRRPSDKKQTKINLGVYPDLSLKEARKEAEKYRDELTAGRDPQMVKSAEYEKNASVLSMQQLTEAWLDNVKANKSLSANAIAKHEWRWNLYLKKHLGNLATDTISRAHISAALDAMSRKGIKEETRKALTTINKALDYGLARHLVSDNPARLLKPQDFGATASKPRKRNLNIDELTLLWGVLHQATSKTDDDKSCTVSFVQANALKLLILTGARRGEVAEMKWAEVNRRTRTWTLPPERTKNGEGHTVYLSDMALAVLRDMETWSKGRTFVFQSERKEADCPIHRDSLTQIVLRLTGQKKSKEQTQRGYTAPLEQLEPFTVHDLRRSAATLWGEKLKVLPHVIEKMLNHQPQNKLIQTYQHAAYVEEQRKAWNDWGKYLERKLFADSSNVVEFPQPVKA
ncbi:MAG: tyrosine-type recombinase/integrase [Hahellaceae bacterium]|nr:tyrosine-type recombinase/integrase [Hahellaceae bacterium]